MGSIINIEDVKSYISNFCSYKNKTDQEVLIQNLLDCEQISLLQNEKSLLIQTRIYLTEYYIQINDLQNALNIALLNKKMAETEGLQEEELKCYSGLLNIYYLLGDYSTLEELIGTYREKLLDSNDLNKLCSLYIISAIQYYTLKDYKKCIEANEKALEFAIKLDNKPLLIHVYNNYGFHAINYDLQLAEKLLFECLQLIKSTDNDTYSLAAVYGNLADLYFQLKDYRSCNKYLDIAIKLLKSLNNKSILLEAQNRLSELFIYTEKYFAAEKLLLQIEKECLATNNRYTVLASFNHFQNLYEKTGRYKDAYEYLLKYQVLKEELFNEESNQKIRNLQIANEVSNIKRQRDHAEHIAHVKHDFLANMSHEIRTPINSVLGISYLLRQDNLSEKQRGYIQRLELSGQTLLNLINDILDLSKIEAGKLELTPVPFSFNTILSEVIQSLRYKSEEKNIGLRINTVNELDEMIIGDSLKLSQVLINLVSNAIKFTKEGFVEINVSIKKKGINSVIVSCAVKDSGIGISEDKLETIFERYEQASAVIKTQFGGTGLGLAISKKLIDLMNGNISIKSNLNEGSIFTIEIPFEINTSSVGIETEFIPDTSLLNNLNIIIADDNEENRLVTKDILLHFNDSIRIREAVNGQEVIDLVNTNFPDVILMDLDMPVMNGFEAMKHIRNHQLNNNINVIANTAGLLTLTKDEIIEMGFNDLLTKPFKPTDLFRKISNVLK